MWKCVFDSTTKRGVAFNRAAGDGEFMQEIAPANAGWFASEPSRYQYVRGVFSEVPKSVLEEEKTAKEAEMKEQKEAVARKEALIAQLKTDTDVLNSIPQLAKRLEQIEKIIGLREV